MKNFGKKPIFEIPAKTVINFDSAFKDKLLCDGIAFSTGSACYYSCSFCYVPQLMIKDKRIKDIADKTNTKFEDFAIRRGNALNVMRNQLFDNKGKARFTDPNDNRVAYSSPLVDVAASVELAKETIEACKLILNNTFWQIRLLSKSNLLPMIAHELGDFKERVIYGVSTGTLNDKLAKSFEEGTPLVSKRIASLHKLQDEGFRTFGMVCPSLPQNSYDDFSKEILAAIRADKCEHVWAEVINVRGESMIRTCKALTDAGFVNEANMLKNVSTDSVLWEQYARDTYLSHAKYCNNLRFLQYVTKDSLTFWDKKPGAVLLGTAK